MANSTDDVLSASDLALIADALSCAASDFSDQSCNDFSVPRTKDNLAALLPVVAAQGEADPAAWLESSSTSKDTYVVPDEWAAACFAERLGKAPPASITSAEAVIVADLLEALAELHAEWAEQDDEAERHPHAARLAQRCRDLAAAGAIVRIAVPARAAAAVSAHGIPVIAPPGVADRFPDLKKYLKDYTVNFADWELNDLKFLRTYADQGPGFDYKTFDYAEGPSYCYRNKNAMNSVEHCAMMLRWHAIQVVLGAAVPKRAVSKGAAACAKRFEALQKRAPHIWNLGDEAEVRDFKVAKHLLYAEAFEHAEVEQALLASPGMSAVAEGERAAYAARVAKAAADDPATRCYIRMREQEQDDLEAYRKEIGKDWTIPWRRGLAYHYHAAHMAGRLGDSIRGELMHLVANTVHCLLIGWNEWAQDMHRLCHAQLAREMPDLVGKKPYAERRTQLFAMRLLDQWFEKPGGPYPPQAATEPIFEALLAHWRHPDADAIAPLLLAACDRHTLASVAKGSPDLEKDEYWYDPYEILLVLHLRGQMGLPNPKLDHPIMNTKLGDLRTKAPVYQEALLDAVVARFNAEMEKAA